MSGREDPPVVVVERSSGTVGAFLIGALIGAGAALLLAPRSGEETQEELKEQARRLRARAEERLKDAQRVLGDRLDQARAGVEDRVDHVREAVQAGREAAASARGDLERRIEQSKAAYRAGVEAAKAAVEEAPSADEPGDAEA